MAAPREVAELVQRFSDQYESYRADSYNETQVRREFVDPLFKALGWDVDNENGYAEAYKEVIHEDSIKIGDATKAPDYSFRIGGVRKFFVETKKPAVNIRDDVSPAYQLRRYAWSAKLPLSILTDFEELAVYDCRVRPEKNDKASTARTLFLKFDQYEEKWDELAAIFSRDAILRGSFDKYADSAKKKHGTAEVDDAFLKEIEEWRSELARNLALRNRELSQRDINYAVQKTIDRIIFLRICEDRGIERYGQLQALLNGDKSYARLCEMFRRADDRYNSGLFHFTKERSRPEEPDKWTLGLEVDDRVLKGILRRLYYPESPYEFSVLGADILGQVYEQFLGKVIRLTKGHQAKVEDKPEVKKAGGVYYTPTYIVDYIVGQTVGKLLEGKAPHEAAGRTKTTWKRSKRARPLSVLDPACGSGSFLIGAYQHLLNWYRDWYIKHGPKKFKDRIYQTRKDEWRLTTAERKRILLDHIYGVDIDSQAVEVTKLSLLLKVLEGETEETLQRQLFAKQRALPDLSENIKCGNSLIGPDFYQGKQLDLFDDEERLRINVFDWKAEFAEIMRGGGFDAVVGNPPYVRPHNIKPEDKQYFWRHFSTFIRKSDLYCCFIEQSVRLLGREGAFGFIVSNGFLRLDSFEALREHLLKHTAIDRIIDFTGNVFDKASVRAAILLFTKEASPEDLTVATTEPGVDLSTLSLRTIRQEMFNRTYKRIFDLSLDERTERIKEKMRKCSSTIQGQFAISFGIKTGDDEKFLSHEQIDENSKPFLRGEDIHRYSHKHKGEFVWYVPKEMTKHRRTARPGNPARYEQPKVLVRDTGRDFEADFDNEDYYVKDVLVLADEEKDERRLKALLGILNSSAMRWYYRSSFPTLHVQRDEISVLPIPHGSLTSSPLTSLVDCMLSLQKKLPAAKTPHEQTALQREIAALDGQIDGLVYELYGLTGEEIRIVEEATAPKG